MSGENQAIEAIDRAIAHLETLKIGSTITEKFATEHAQLLQQTRALIQALLVESRHVLDAYQALQEKYTNAVRQQ
jgi:hypothetical protein